MTRPFALTLALLTTLALQTTAFAQDPAAQLAQASAATAAPDTTATAEPEPSAAEPTSPAPRSRFLWGIDALATADYSVAAANAVLDDDDNTSGVPGYVGGGINVNLGARLFDGTDKNGIPYGLTAGYRLTAEYKDGIDGLGMPGFYVTQRHQVSLGFHLLGTRLIEFGGGALASTGPGGTVGGYTFFFQGHIGGERGVGAVFGLNVDVYASEQLDDGTHPVAMNMFFGIGWRSLGAD